MSVRVWVISGSRLRFDDFATIAPPARHRAHVAVAKRKTLFDDRPIEISELTYIIRQDIASLNTQIASLQSYVRSKKASSANSGSGAAASGKQVEEHNSNVVMLLQSKLAEMGMGFKDVLELRTQVGWAGLLRLLRVVMGGTDCLCGVLCGCGKGRRSMLTSDTHAGVEECLFSWLRALLSAGDGQG